MESVAAFTDTYLPTINGVSYTIETWRDRWTERGGRMDVVYPRADGHVPETGEYPVGSLPFPFYDGFRLALPRVPSEVRDVDIIHAHTPFSLGVAALWLARRTSVPVVASYHTPVMEYADYLAVHSSMAAGIRAASKRWTRWFLDNTDVVLAPTAATRRHLRDSIGLTTDIHVLPNGVDTERFRPVDPSGFVASHSLDTDRPLVGYTGRHGYEKRLGDLVDAAAALDVTLVIAGDGPARGALEQRAADRGADARFLGFLDRGDLPAFYAALDVFGFPSPVETQGLVALEAIACGTPVVGVNAGALTETIDDDVTGYHFEPGDIAGFRAGITRALDNHERLQEACLAARENISVERTVEQLDSLYSSV